MKDSELSRLLNIPPNTLHEWKKETSKRKLLYEFLKSFKPEDIQKRLDALKMLDEST